MSRHEYTRRLLLAGVVAVLAALAVRGLPQLAHVGLVLFTAVLFGIVVHGFAAWVSDRTPIPRTAAATATFVLILLLLGLAVWWSGPRMADEFGQLLERVPQIVGDVVDSIEETEWGASLLERLGQPSQAMPDGQQAIGGATRVFSTVTGALTSVLVILFVAFFIAYDPHPYRDAVLALAPEDGRRDHLRSLFFEMARTLRLWMKARLISMGVVGVLTAIALTIAGIPLAFALALVAAVLAFVPFIGPLLASIPAILIGLGESTQTAVIVAAIYGGVQLIESYMITPVVEKKIISLPPAFVIAAQVVMGALFGLMGVFLATPLAIVAVVLVQQLYLRDQLDQDPEPLGD